MHLPFSIVRTCSTCIYFFIIIIIFIKINYSSNGYSGTTTITMHTVPQYYNNLTTNILHVHYKSGEQRLGGAKWCNLISYPPGFISGLLGNAGYCTMLIHNTCNNDWMGGEAGRWRTEPEQT
jgi:hypothetical protein